LPRVFFFLNFDAIMTSLFMIALFGFEGESILSKILSYFDSKGF
jgi:hypothetical protein